MFSYYQDLFIKGPNPVARFELRSRVCCYIRCGTIIKSSFKIVLLLDIIAMQKVT